MNFKPSQVISVVSVTGCPARVKDAAGSGKDGIYYFEAIPEQYVKADESDAYDEIASSLPDDRKAKNQSPQQIHNPDGSRRETRNRTG